MFHAYIIPIATCFIYTSYVFYAFSGTNLLKRCHSASSLFSAIFGFRKAVKEIFSELHETKANIPIIPRKHPEHRRGYGGGPRGGLTWWRHGSSSGRATTWCGPLGAPPPSLFRLLKPPDGKTLSTRTLFQKTLRSRRRRQP